MAAIQQRKGRAVARTDRTAEIERFRANQISRAMEPTTSRGRPTIPTPGPNTPGRKVMERRLADKSDKAYQAFETLANRTATGYGPDGKGIIPHHGVSRAFGAAGDALGSVISKRAEWTAKAEAEGKSGARSAPPPKTQMSRAIDAAVGGATIGAMAYDAGHHAANVASVVTSSASNSQIGAKVGSRIAERGAAGISRTGFSTAVAKAASSSAGQAAGRIIASPIVSGLSRFALPVLGARMAWNAVTGYRRDGIKGAMLGAADAATFGLASSGLNKAVNMYQAAFHAPGGGDPTSMALAKAAGHGVFSSPANAAPAEKQPPGGSPRLDSSKQREFAAANDAFTRSQARTSPAPDGEGGGSRLRGFANPAVQKSAQEARGVQNISDWARNAEPGEKSKGTR